MTFLPKTLILTALMQLCSHFIYAQEYCIITVGSDTVAVGDTFCVPVTVKNFDYIVGIKYAHTWYPDKLTFLGTKNYNLNYLNASKFFLHPTGRLSLNWEDLTGNGQNHPDGDTIYEICFIATLQDSQVNIYSGNQLYPPSSPYSIENASGANVFNSNINIPGNIAINKIVDTYTPNISKLLNIVPNPFSNNLTVHQYLSMPSIFLLYNNTGHLVNRSLLDTDTQIIQTDHLPAGFYYWVIETAGKPLQSGKLVKGL